MPGKGKGLGEERKARTVETRVMQIEANANGHIIEFVIQMMMERHTRYQYGKFALTDFSELHSSGPMCWAREQ